MWTLLGAVILSTACSQNRTFPTPAAYDLNAPQKIVMPQSLHEISGIAFYKGNTDTFYAQQDEQGRLFYLKPGDKRASSFKFGRSGDYEDVAICNNYVIMLKSNGTLFTFPFGEVRNEESNNVQEWKGLLPEGEYEGMYADEKHRLLYIICKNCAHEKASKIGKGYILQLDNAGTINRHGSFAVNVGDIESVTGIKKVKFHPSALALNPLTKEWFIITSINKLLVICDTNWKVKEAYKLNPALYIQPEGMAFDNSGNLYISNEGGDIHAGNVLKIRYSGK